jgi:hypothetical protein
MRGGQGRLLWWGAWLGLLAAGPTSAQTQQSPDAARFTFPVRSVQGSGYSLPRIPVEQLPPTVRDNVRRVLEQPTLAARGPAESFTCQPVLYHWLLDHPDQAVRLWRQLGARVTEVEDRGQGRFGYRDATGTDIHWETVLLAPGLRVWYAEGLVKPALLVPRAHLQAVLILSCQQGTDEHNHSGIKHQMHLMVKTDSRVVSVAARMLGSSAPRLAEQYMGQLQMFYGALAWYLDQDEQRARKMFAAIGLTLSPTAPPR